MKKLMMLMLMLVLSGCAGMQSYEPARESSIENVIDAPGYNQNQIYTATKIWIAENFRSAKAVIENDDRGAGVIVGKASVKYPCTTQRLVCANNSDMRLEFTLRVDIKDQKFKITLSNMATSYHPGDNHPLWQHEISEEAYPALSQLSAGLRAAVEKEKSKSNW